MHNPVRFIDPTGLWATVVNGSTTNPLIGGPASNARTIIHRPWQTMSSSASNTSTPTASEAIEQIFTINSATAEQMGQLERAMDYLLTSPTATTLIMELMSRGETTLLVFNNSSNANFLNQTQFNQRRIQWDPTAAFVLGNGTHALSPAIALAHEMAHILQDLDGDFLNVTDMVYDIENPTLENWEFPIVRELQGEAFLRNNYFDTSRSIRVNTSTDWGYVHTRPWYDYINPFNWGQPRKTLTQNLNTWRPQ